ncbi:MAG: hypothetical protein ACW99G_04885 [Candidatus Thorarchaeota archaeon]|jgi:hypothetical protein
MGTTGYKKKDFQLGDRVQIVAPQSRHHEHHGTVTGIQSLAFVRVLPDNPHPSMANPHGALYYGSELIPLPMEQTWEV